MQPVYPRWRGEHPGQAGNVGILPGLSPLARGTPNQARYVHPCNRFIPAGAGNTSAHPAPSLLRTVYPRWRGEHGHRKEILVCWSGLSPLARGTQDSTFLIDDSERFIPAGAGNTLSYDTLINAWPVYPRWRGEHYS